MVTLAAAGVPGSLSRGSWAGPAARGVGGEPSRAAGSGACGSSSMGRRSGTVGIPMGCAWRRLR
eukprot:14567523-Alexandrium_andersonii.AAC.1